MASLLDLFSDTNALRIFENIADKKRADFRGVAQETKLGDDAASEALDRLVEGGLIERVKGPLKGPVSDTYTLSAKGLSARRQIKTLARE